MRCVSRFLLCGSFLLMLFAPAQGAAPTVNSFNPTGGGAGAAITITGTNFSSATEVRFGSVGTKFTIDSPTQITAFVPPLASISSVQTGITVINPDGSANNGGTFTGGVAAGSKRWIGAYPGDPSPTNWFDPLHWTPTGVPGPGDSVVVDTGGGGLTISGGDITVDSLTLFRVVMAGTSNITVTTKINCVNSSLGGVRTYTLPAGSEVEMYGVDFLGNGIGSETIVNNSGTIRAISGQCFLSGQSGNLATLNNLAGGVVELWDTESISGGGAGVFNNTGTVQKVATVGSASITVTFNNTNSVIVPAGTLNVNTTTVTTTGAFHAAPGATLQFNVGSLTANAGALWTGTVTSSGGLWHINGDAQLGTTGLPCTLTSNSNMDGTATFTITGNSTMNSTGGVMQGTGETEVAAGGHLNISNGLDFRQRTLTNGGTLTLIGTATMNLGNLAVLNSQAGATIDLQGNSSFGQFNSGSLPGLGATINNAGTLLKSAGAGTGTISVEFNNSGIVNVQVGTLAIGQSGVAGAATGTFNVPGGTTLNFATGTYNLNAGSAVSGAGTCNISSATVHVAGSYNMTNTTIGVSGVANFNATANTVGGTSTGTIGGTGTFNITGVFAWNGGTMNSSGATNIASTGRLNLATTNQVTLQQRTLNNSGLVVWSGNSLFAVGDGGVVNNLAGATFDIQNDGDMNFFGSGGTFNNNGTLQKTAGSGESVISVVFSNGGTIDIRSGTIRFGSGGFTQTAGTTRLNGGILAANNTLLFQGGTLAGNGTINGNVTNGGTLSLGTAIGTLAINGNYVQNAGGILNIRIGGPAAGTQHDQVNIGGSATLGGTLNISLVNGFAPNGDSFVIMTYASRTGSFATVNGLNVGGGKVLTATANATNFIIADPSTPVTVFTISGRVANSGGIGVGNVRVTRTGSSTFALTNASGNYLFTNVPAGSYTVAPNLLGYNFSPTSRTFAISSANATGINFTATIATFTIRGRVANNSGTGIPNVLVARNGSNSVATDSNGDYIMSGVTVGSYTIAPVMTPSLNGVTFNPTSYSVNVSTFNLTNINFTAQFTITGRVSSSSGIGLPNILVTRTSGASAVTVSTDASGNFKFGNVRSGSYSIALQIPPSMTGMTSNPSVYNVTVNTSNLTNINFTALFAISGRITTSGGTGIANVLVRSSTPTSSTTVLTDASGNYRFTGVRSGDYTLTPTKSGNTFTPVSKSVTVTIANVGNQNFIGTGP